jgi:transposase InsO family protein
MTIWNVENNYKREGFKGFEKKKKGRPFQILNPKFFSLVVCEWEANKCGARKLHEILKRKGFGVSRRKIEQVLVKEGFQKAVLKRRKPRKYKRYEWPFPNYMWHTDWHIIKSEKFKGQNILVFIDDCSRKIMSYVIGNQTTKNSLFALYKAISDHGVIPYCLNSDRGSQFIANKFDKNGKANHEFQIVLGELGILFIPSKKRHPQTNGKNERFFGILDNEFDDRFETIGDFINWYNQERLSEAVDYMTPNESYKNRL